MPIGSSPIAPGSALPPNLEQAIGILECLDQAGGGSSNRGEKLRELHANGDLYEMPPLDGGQHGDSGYSYNGNVGIMLKHVAGGREIVRKPSDIAIDLTHELAHHDRATSAGTPGDPLTDPNGVHGSAFAADFHNSMIADEIGVICELKGQLGQCGIGNSQGSLCREMARRMKELTLGIRTLEDDGHSNAGISRTRFFTIYVQLVTPPLGYCGCHLLGSMDGILNVD